MKTPDEHESNFRPARLPGFLNENDVGLGDLIKRAASYAGIKPCGGCEARAAALNRRFVFSSRHLKMRSS
jgi:hypothetical protein